MSSPNVIDMSAVAGSLLVSARFDFPKFEPISKTGKTTWTSRNLLECRGLTPKRAVVRLGTVLIRYDGALMPLWSNYGTCYIHGWAEKVLLAQIAQRLNLRQPGRV